MLVPTIIMGVLAAVLIFIAYNRGEGAHILGLKSAGGMLIQLIPLLIFAMIIAGMVQALLPQELVSKWIGAESGFRGLLLGAVMGSITPGGPFVSMPITAGLLRAGASIGTIGGIHDGMVIGRNYPVTPGNRLVGLEIRPHSSGLYLLLPANSRADSQ